MLRLAYIMALTHTHLDTAEADCLKCVFIIIQDYYMYLMNSNIQGDST